MGEVDWRLAARHEKTLISIMTSSLHAHFDE